MPGVPAAGAGRPSVYAVGGSTGDQQGPGQRFANDNPPPWDGKNSQTQAEPFFKKLCGWLLTSRTLRTQQGFQILNACTSRSELELIINEIRFETLIQEDGGKIVYDHIYNSYKEYIELSMTKHLEGSLYSDDCICKKGEALLSCTAKRRILFRYLDNTGIRLPDDAKGYLILRDSKISATAWDTITTWTKSSYDYNTVIASLRRLERPAPGHGGHTSTGLSTYVENPAHNFTGLGGQEEEYICGMCGSDNGHDYVHDEIYLNGSFYLPPESFNDLDIEENEFE